MYIIIVYFRLQFTSRIPKITPKSSGAFKLHRCQITGTQGPVWQEAIRRTHGIWSTTYTRYSRNRSTYGFVYICYWYDAHLIYIILYYTLRFHFPYLSLLAQPVNITLYGPGLDCLVFDSVPERYLHYYFRWKV